jgi:N-acetylmuramoyl-L-alanine amidase
VEAKRIYSTAGRDQLARAIADGILAYKRLLER